MSFSVKCLLQSLEEQTIANLDRLLGFPRERKRFLQSHNYPLNLNEPVSFNEKICWKKIHDRNPLLPIIADKFRVRDYVRQQLGDAVAAEVLIPLLQVLQTPEDLDLSALPESFVIKSNHGSGNNLLIHDRADFDFVAFQKEAVRWLNEPYGLRNHEWAYSKIPRKILVETMLQDETGKIPADYKFSMIHGECAFIQVDGNRFEELERSLFDREWQYLDVRWKRKQGPSLPRPANFETMLDLARKLSAPLDYVRVDFYSIGSKVYLGELTNYPARGRGRITPRQFDLDMGKLWTLNDPPEAFPSALSE